MGAKRWSKNGIMVVILNSAKLKGGKLQSVFLVVKEEESTNCHSIWLKGNLCKETLGLKNAITHLNCEVDQNIHMVSGGV